MCLPCKNYLRLRSLAAELVAISVLVAGSSVATGEMVPDFALQDVNSISATYGQLVSPRDYLQQVSAWYFGQAGGGTCRTDVGYLDQMQRDLDANDPEADIRILGVNRAGYESGSSAVTAGRDIPWLQDVDGNHDGFSDVWTSWDVQYRDLVILNGENEKLETFSLVVYDLRNPDSYDALRKKLIAAATVPEPAGVTLLAAGAAGLFICRRRNRDR